MKILTKILNIVVGVLVLLGIAFIFYYFYVIRPQKVEYQELTEKNQQLNEQLRQNNTSLRILKDSISIKDAEIRYRDEYIGELNNVILGLRDELKDNIQLLEDMPLEEVLGYILDYYNTDSTEASIITYNDRIEVIVKPRLVREWSYTLAKLESAEITIDTYENQVNEYECLVSSYEDKIQLLEERDSLFQNSLDIEQEKNSNFKTLLDNRNRKIKSITLQRNLISIGACVVIVIALI